MSETVLGIQSGALRNINGTVHPTRGTSYDAVYEGTESYIQGIFLTLSSGLVRRIDRSAAPLIRLYVSAGDDNTSETSTEVITTFELNGNRSNVPLNRAPPFINLDQQSLLWIKALAEEGKYSSRVYNSASQAFLHTYEDIAQLPSEAHANPLYLEYYYLILHGHTEFPISEYVFTVTQAISNRYSGAVALANVHKTYSGAQLTSEAIGSATIFAPIDLVMASVQPSEPYTTAPDVTTYVFGWLKMAPRIQCTGIKFQVVNEWYLGLWPTRLYPLAT